jgi:hypothetical protein
LTANAVGRILLALERFLFVLRYRKLAGRLHQWHDTPHCPEWPTSGFVEHEAPAEKDICPKCISFNALEKQIEITKKTKVAE